MTRTDMKSIVEGKNVSGIFSQSRQFEKKNGWNTCRSVGILGEIIFLSPKQISGILLNFIAKFLNHFL